MEKTDVYPLPSAAGTRSKTELPSIDVCSFSEGEIVTV